jgi:hypothetical protein
MRNGFSPQGEPVFLGKGHELVLAREYVVPAAAPALSQDEEKVLRLLKRKIQRG